MSDWRPIETAPEDESILLVTKGSPLPIYCGEFRFGAFYEPQPSVEAWRCDSSGRFADPTHWMPLPRKP